MWDFKFTKALHASGRLGYVTLLVFGMVSASCRGGVYGSKSEVLEGRSLHAPEKLTNRYPKIAIIVEKEIHFPKPSFLDVFGICLCENFGGLKLPCTVFKVHQLTHSLQTVSHLAQNAQRFIFLYTYIYIYYINIWVFPKIRVPQNGWWK